MSIAGTSNGELERKLWETATKLRGPVDPSEYKDYTLGLLFLKKMSEAFEERRQKLEEKTRDPDSRYYVGDDEEEREYILTDKDEYTSETVFYIPEEARWQYLVDNATDPQIGQQIDEAMRAVEEENPRLKGMLPKGYSRSTLPHDSLEGLINLFADLEMDERDENGDKKEDEDIFGRVYEFFIKKFAMESGQKGGEFYTPKSVVELLVEILEPYEGRIFDPFCGSGGMFVQSHKFLQSHGGDTDQISIYGQEIKESTWRISKMNLYLRGLDGNIKLGDSIRDDQHQGLDADYIIANPPFNMDGWGRDAVASDDPRFKYGVPPNSSGNFAFIQHMIHHLNDGGICGTVMSNGALAVKGEEGDIREKIIEDDLVDTIIALPNRLFYTTEIPVSLWILSKGKGKHTESQRNRKDESLFIDAREMFLKVDKTHKTLDKDHITEIAEKVRSYRGEPEADEYEDEPGFCKIATRKEIQSQDYILAPGRYVGIEGGIGRPDIPFEERMDALSEELRMSLDEEAELRKRIEASLDEVGF
ncbi:type I restriction-modification system subunit M [Halostagnicola bangensis]